VTVYTTPANFTTIVRELLLYNQLGSPAGARWRVSNPAATVTVPLNNGTVAGGTVFPMEEQWTVLPTGYLLQLFIPLTASFAWWVSGTELSV
jgi:hypothetical protein